MSLWAMLILCILTVSAQTEHLKFMGIPITGTPIQMGEKLKAKGFIFKEKLDEDFRVYKGKFAGSNVEVSVVSSNNLVWKILVEYPKASSFSELLSDYNEMVKQFKKKYNEPYDHFEFFSKPYYEGDGYELQALKLNKCHYASFWKLDFGTICVEMAKYGRIWIGYEDKLNVKAKEVKEEQQIQNDI